MYFFFKEEVFIQLISRFGWSVRAWSVCISFQILGQMVQLVKNILSFCKLLLSLLILKFPLLVYSCMWRKGACMCHRCNRNETLSMFAVLPWWEKINLKKLFEWRDFINWKFSLLSSVQNYNKSFYNSVI